MQTTANLGLKKPDGTDVVNIQDFNDNADLLDMAVAAKETPTGAQAKANAAEANAKAYADTKVAGLVNSSPAALDTLKELADALGSDPNYAATTATLIGTKANQTDFVAHQAVVASETVKGHVELATAAETTTGADNTRAVHPAGLKVELDKKANLASPALTGTPTAPTAAVATNNTQIATTAFVKAVVAALVDSSPAALDTLNELAAALGDDPNFATTITNLIATKSDQTTVDAHLAENATLITKGHVQLSSATNSSSETLAATPKAVKDAFDLANTKQSQLSIKTGTISHGGTIPQTAGYTNYRYLVSPNSLTYGDNVSGGYRTHPIICSVNQSTRVVTCYSEGVDYSTLYTYNGTANYLEIAW